MQIKTISPAKIEEVFKLLSWSSNVEDGFIVFKSPDKTVITPLPKEEKAESYAYYQDKALKILLYALNLEEKVENLTDLADQITAPTYKIFNRIALKEKYSNTAVPFELATNFPLKNIEAFRTYCLKRTNGRQSIPISDFEFNHTQVGSFVIPVSIKVNPEPTLSFHNYPNITHTFIKDYLSLIDTLVNVDIQDKKNYANAIVDAGIDASIVKDIIGHKGSIATYKEKYISSVEALTITSKSNILLDRKLSENDKKFKKVDLGKLKPLELDVVELIEDIETSRDESSVNYNHADIEVLVDAVDENGTAKFTILKINKEEPPSVFKARTTKLPKSILDFCADAFKTRDPILIKGDIEKQKGKMGDIYHESFGAINRNHEMTLFDGIEKEDS